MHVKEKMGNQSDTKYIAFKEIPDMFIWALGRDTTNISNSEYLHITCVLGCIYVPI